MAQGSTPATSETSFGFGSTAAEVVNGAAVLTIAERAASFLNGEHGA